MGRQWKQCQTLFFWAPKSLQMVTAAMKLKDAYSLEVMTNLDRILKSGDITLPTKVHLVKAMIFPVVMYRCESWTVVLEKTLKKTWESLGLQGDPTSPSWRRSALGVHWKDWCWSWNSNTLATSCEELTHWKRPWCWEGLGAGGEGDDRGWDGWMASPTRRAWVWVNSRSWWWTGRPGMLWFMGSQRVGHDWATELNWIQGSLRIRGKTNIYCLLVFTWINLDECIRDVLPKDILPKVHEQVHCDILTAAFLYFSDVTLT